MLTPRTLAAVSRMLVRDAHALHPSRIWRVSGIELHRGCRGSPSAGAVWEFELVVAKVQKRCSVGRAGCMHVLDLGRDRSLHEGVGTAHTCEGDERVELMGEGK